MEKVFLILSFLTAHTSLFAAETFTDEEKKTATSNLVWAAQHGNLKEAHAALCAGAHINGDYSVGPHGEIRGDIPLTKACHSCAEINKAVGLSKSQAQNYLKTVALLLEHGALVTAVDNEGQTAIGYTCQGNLPEILEFLLKHGAPYEEEDNKTIGHRFLNKTCLYKPNPCPELGVCVTHLWSAAEKHVETYREYRKANPELNALLKAHETSFVVKGFSWEAGV